MSLMKTVDIKASEKAVEIRFAEWVMAMSIIERLEAKKRDLDYSTMNTPHDIQTTLDDFIQAARPISVSYTPLSGNIEEILGDAFCEQGSKFSLIEMKGYLTATAWKREWDVKTSGSSNKGRGIVFNSIKPGDEREFTRISDQCHFIMGLRPRDEKEVVPTSDEITFALYWPFIRNLEMIAQYD
jgi:hypothetical protein